MRRHVHGQQNCHLWVRLNSSRGHWIQEVKLYICYVLEYDLHITWFSCRPRVILVDQELQTRPKHLRSSPLLWSSCYSILSFLFSSLLTIVYYFVLFHLVIVLSVLRCTAYCYHYGIFNLFLYLFGQFHNLLSIHS